MFNYGKNYFFEFVFSLLLYVLGDYYCKQLLTSKFNCSNMLKAYWIFKEQIRIHIFLQKTHPVSNKEKFWAVDFKIQDFSFLGISNSCGVLIVYLVWKPFTVKSSINDDTGHISILDFTIDDYDFILINI